MMQDPSNAFSDALLDKLQDIHGAAEPSLWPPAPGWWLIAAIGLAVVLYLLVLLFRKLRVRLRRRRLLRELDGLAVAFDPQTRSADYLAGLNRLFKAIAIRAFPDSGCARMQGSDWVAFICQHLPGGADIQQIEALEAGPYQRKPEFDPQVLQARARQWVLSHG